MIFLRHVRAAATDSFSIYKDQDHDALCQHPHLLCHSNTLIILFKHLSAELGQIISFIKAGLD